MEREILTTARLSKVDPDQLHHVGLQQIDVPPRTPLHVCQRARVSVEEGGRGPVHRLLGDAAVGHAALHGGLASGDVKH